MIEKLDHWYDAQMRRFLAQIVRAFSGFQYTTGWKDGQAPQAMQVPCRLASTDRMVANMIKNGSENTLNTVPMIVIYQTGIAGRRQDVQNLNHVDSRVVQERAIDPVSGKYTPLKGHGYTVQRMMPRPFEMTVNVDIWTSTTDQKHQLFEQIATIFYPDIYIQNSDNALDWTAMTTMEWVDCQWSSRAIPVGTNDEIDVLTISFRLPIWISPPAKVMQMKLIEQVISNIHDGRHTDEISADNHLFRHITTPGNHSVRVENGKILLLGPEGSEHGADGNTYTWKKLIDLYGVLRPTLSTIHLLTSTDLDDRTRDVIGTIQYDNNNPNEIFFQIDPDTLPQNTMDPINAVIDPREHWAGKGLPAATEGQRYLLLHSIMPDSIAWGSLEANENSIIEYQNGEWIVAFDGKPETNPTPQRVLNLGSSRQLKFATSVEDQWEWSLAIDGTYYPGTWRLDL
jgi:hypothetical protein